MKKLKPVHYVIGSAVLLLIVAVIWYNVESKKKPTSLIPSPGSSPAPRPTGNANTIPPELTNDYAIATAPLTVYNENFTKYYDAVTGNVLGKIVGVDGSWTIIISASTSEKKYVWTNFIRKG